MAKKKELSTIEKLKEEIKRLKDLAYKDELTRLYNRRGFSEEARKFLSEIATFKKFPERRENFIITNFSIIVFDADDFKKVNDTYGHDAGDAVLRNIGAIVNESVRDIDLAARWGGEEIVLGLVGASEDDAFRIAEAIRKKVMYTPVLWKRKKILVTVSGGVAGFDNVDTFEELFQLADKAVYKAKHAGKNVIIRASELKKK